MPSGHGAARVKIAGEWKAGKAIPVPRLNAQLQSMGMTYEFIEIRCGGHAVNHGRRVKRSRIAFATRITDHEGDPFRWTLVGSMGRAIDSFRRNLPKEQLIFDRRTEARPPLTRTVYTRDSFRDVLECSRCRDRLVFADFERFTAVWNELARSVRHVVTIPEVRDMYAAADRTSRR